MSYQAIVARLKNVREHPNADRLKLASIGGVQIVVGLDAQEDELGIFFPEDGRLTPEFCEANDLYPRYENGERVGGGFFDPKNSRVRAQKFRGEKSTGFFTSLESVSYTGIDPNLLVEGYLFEELNGVKICEKYYSPKTLKAMNANQGRQRKENVMFPKHIESKRFQYVQGEVLREGNHIYITEKLHGTSGRYGLVLEEVETRKARWYNKLLKKRGLPQTEMQWKFVVGSKNIVINDPLTQGFYGNDSFRFEAAESFRDNMRKGEIFYGELVGWAGGNTPIMSNHTVKEELKEIKKQYGHTMAYTYGVPQGEVKFYVYRIAHTDPDGNLIELPWTQVKRRCRELGLDYVPEYRDFYCDSVFGDNTPVAGHVRDVVAEGIDQDLEGPSLLDPRHIREGVVLRVESADGEITFVKHKSHTFGVLEGYIKDQDDYVDLEEIS